MLRFEATRRSVSRWPRCGANLTDARFLLECLPDVDKVSVAEQDRAVFVVRPGLSFVRGNLDVIAQIVEKVEPASIRIELVSRGIGSSSTVETVLTLTAQDAQTEVQWVAEVKELGACSNWCRSGLHSVGGSENNRNMWDALRRKWPVSWPSLSTGTIARSIAYSMALLLPV